ncbi:uncharacterized protein [Miscanthus floridulus]|uniref:uncharacterized protein n=1 Tax=Miscanthus floridulus TaxID=154761 RepID=UPI0034599F54
MQLPLDDEDRALFNAATRVDLGNGKRASFWCSRWLQGDAPATLFPALFQHSKRKNRTVKDALTDSKWVRDVDHNMSAQIIGEFVDLWVRIQDTQLLPAQEHRITWLRTSDGQYTAKLTAPGSFSGDSPLADQHTGEQGGLRCRGGISDGAAAFGPS